MPAKVFISYSRADSAYVKRLTDHLRAAGVDAWFDQDIAYSDQWWRRIVREIRAADAVLLVMTPALEDSEWIVKEVLLARRESKPIYPLLLEGDGLPLVIDIQHVDVTGERMPPDDFVAAVRNLRVPEVTPAASPFALDALVRELARQEGIAMTAGEAIRGGFRTADIYVRRAGALNELLRAREALAAAEEALLLAPGNLDAMFQKGQALSNLDDYAGARAVAEEMAAAAPWSWDAVALRADALNGMDENDAALRWADRALAARPGHEWALLARGQALTNLGRTDEALAHADRIIALLPGSVVGYMVRVGALWTAQRFDETRPLVEGLSLLYPHSEVSYVLRSLLAAKAEDWPAAEEHVRRAIAMNPGRTASHELLAPLVYRQGRPLEALEGLERATELMPRPPRRRDASILADRAELLHELGRPDEARLIFDWALRLDPDVVPGGWINEGRMRPPG